MINDFLHWVFKKLLEKEKRDLDIACRCLEAFWIGDSKPHKMRNAINDLLEVYKL